MEPMLLDFSKIARVIFIVFVTGVEFRTVIRLGLSQMADYTRVFERVIVNENLVTDYVFAIG